PRRPATRPRAHRPRHPRRGSTRRRSLPARHGPGHGSRIPANPKTKEVRSTMSRPDPIQYAERLYAAIREANFSPISFLAFGNAVKEGIALRNMPRTAAEPFMRVVGEMLDLEEDSTEQGIIDAA